MNNPNLAVGMKKRRFETIARQKRKREQREYVGNISVRNIVRNLAKLSKEEQEKAYEELKKDFPEARNKELRRDQFDKSSIYLTIASILWFKFYPEYI